MTEGELRDDVDARMNDLDPAETGEWIESLDALVAEGGPERARFVLDRLIERAAARNVFLPTLTSTPYLNTIPRELEPAFPGDEQMELRIRRMIRWNAMAMVVRANHHFAGIGGHLATYASTATLYEVGFNHFFRGKDDGQDGDQIYFQGHAAPGIYARAFLEGRLTEEQLEHFRREVVKGRGLSSYPHPRLMPEFWEFPVVSMGLGPLAAVYQARFNRYLANRGIKDTSASRVWCFCGDGELDEPEALGAIPVAAREGLDNLTFVVNCNLQRLDGPVRGNGKIIQELEAIFRGAGWNVIKVVWGREWDDLLARDADGVLVAKMSATLDGEYQRLSISDGAAIRERFFGPDPRLRKLVEHLSDDDLTKLRRGGHDYRKVYAAYWHALQHRDRPTVVLAKTVKGWALGPSVEARNVTHQAKKMSLADLKYFRDRIQLPIPDAKLEEVPYYHPGPENEVIQYLIERRRQLGGFVPRRLVRAKPLDPPEDKTFGEFAAGSGKLEVSTTMAFTRLLRNLVRDPKYGRRIVPIIPDEARTFGMDPLFKEIGIYSPVGQRYEPVDAETLLPYREAKEGQLIEEGITEAGAMGTFTAAGTAYATHGEPMIPFYIFYSMFGHQRTGDQWWAFGDARGRGFLMGATAGRTTLNGEGLQHEDGQSLLTASHIPNIRVYDPAFAYEVAEIVREGIARMYVRGEDVFYYLTLYNENYLMPPLPEGAREGIVQGLYLFRPAPEKRRLRVTLLGSGSALPQVLAAQRLLEEKFDVAADVWSATSYQLLRNEALEAERWTRLHPDEEPHVPYVVRQLGGRGPIVAASDFLKAVPDQIGRFLAREVFVPLGTDGFGRSDTREALRRHFETDPAHVAVASLWSLQLVEAVPPSRVKAAIRELGVDPDTVDPRHA